MVRQDKHEDAIRSLHAVFVWLRALANQKVDYDVIEKACDVAEILPTYLVRKEDLTDDFRRNLEELKIVHVGFGLALEYFDGKGR
jgi:hypothetical protein